MKKKCPKCGKETMEYVLPCPECGRHFGYWFCTDCLHVEIENLGNKDANTR